MALNKARAVVGRLHVITEEGGGSRPFRSHAELARLALRGGADTIQYRNKSGDIRTMLHEAEQVLAVCREFGVPLIVNDRVDLCLAIGADGVHLGLNDMPVRAARRILGATKIIGATVRGVPDLERAQAESADYVGLGPIFATASKSLPIAPLGSGMIEQVAAVAKIPVIAIAGITVENLPEVMNAGASGVAVISAVSQAPDPYTATQQFCESMGSSS